MGKHIRNASRENRRPLNPQKACWYWCDGYADGYCYSIDFQDGKIGILASGGLAGTTQFTPLLDIITTMKNSGRI